MKKVGKRVRSVVKKNCLCSECIAIRFYLNSLLILIVFFLLSANRQLNWKEGGNRPAFPRGGINY